MSFFNLSLPVAIGADHAGFEYKAALVKYLQEKSISVKDFGTDSSASVDYPDFARPVADCVAKGQAAFGILLCGTANGVSITANRNLKVRAALCWMNEVAILVRKHNDANVLCIPARFISLQLTKELVDTFMTTAFEGGRHAMRINKITQES